MLDHIVVHVGRGKMDAAAAASEALGFTLTDRGYHSMGSINHLMMFEQDYLELLGVPAGDTTSRPELQGAPLGLNGLVFKTDDADGTYRHLQAIGMAGEPPKAFTRPVETPNGTRDARFRTVTVRSDVFAAGRVYFCEHNTPELVWRPDLPELQHHLNGARSIREIVIVSEAPVEEAANFAMLLEAPVSPEGNAVEVAGFRVAVVTRAEYSARFGELALPRPLDADRQRSMFGAVGVSCRGGVDSIGQNGQVHRLEGFDTLVQFWSADASM
eukprot:COSAG02_NODE_1774_length_10973_cov_18.317914_3_plen_271_part_00